MRLLITPSVEDVGDTTPTAVVAVFVLCHEHATAAGFRRALFSEARHLPIALNLVKLEDSKLNFLVLVLLLLRLCVGLLLALFTSTKEFEILEQSSLLHMKPHYFSPFQSEHTAKP